MVRNLFVSGLWLSFISLLHYIISLFSRSVYADFFGTSREMDVFFLVMGVVIWFNGVVVVAIHKGFVPSFVEVWEVSGGESAWRMFNSVFGVLGLVLLCIGVGCWVFAERIVGLIGMGIERESYLLLLNLFRIGILIIFTNFVSGILTALLFSLGDFVFPRVVRLLGLLVTVGAVVLLARQIGIYSLSLGMLLDGLFSSFCLFFRAVGKGVRFRWSLGGVEVFRFFRVTFPLMVAAFFSQVQELVDRFFVSFLSAGLISCLSYAHLMVSIPVTLFSSGSQVLLPGFSSFSARGDREGLRRSIEQGLGFSFFFSLPALFGLLMLGRDVVVVLFQHGSFDSFSTENTFIVLPYYFGLILFGIPSGIISYALYSLKETGIILWIGVLDFFANIGFNYLFMGWLGHRGIALASSVVLGLDMVLLVFFLQRRVGVFNFGYLLGSFFRVLGASVLMVLVLHLLSFWWPVFPSRSVEFSGLCSLGFRVFVGLLSYVFFAFSFGSMEGRFLVRYFWRKVSLGVRSGV